MNEMVKENAATATDAVSTKPAWHAPVLEEVDYIKTENGPMVVYNFFDGATFYTA